MWKGIRETSNFEKDKEEKEYNIKYNEQPLQRSVPILNPYTNEIFINEKINIK